MLFFGMAEPKRLPSSLNLPFVESLYADFLRDPSSVPTDWRKYFQDLGDGNGTPATGSLFPTLKTHSIFNPPSAGNGQPAAEGQTEAVLQERVDQLIRDYRVRGHVNARLDPLNRPRPRPPELDPGFHGFTEADMDRRFACETMHPGGTLTLR